MKDRNNDYFDPKQELPKDRKEPEKGIKDPRYSFQASAGADTPRIETGYQGGTSVPSY